MQAPRLIEFGSIGNEEIGFLTVAEFGGDLPFKLKRAYWIYNTPELVERGGHAHKEDEIVVICISGEAKIIIKNVENQEFIFNLNKPNQGLYIPKMHWRELSLSNHATLFCLSSSYYDEQDYIRNYKTFQNHTIPK